MESEEEGQWSWWQHEEGAEAPTAAMRATVLADPAGEQGGLPADKRRTAQPPKDPVRAVLIGLVAVLSLTLAGVSYARFADRDSVSGAAVVTTTDTSRPTTTTPEATSTSAPTTVTTTTAPTSTVVVTSSTSAPETTTTVLEPSGPPSPPQDVTVFSTSSTGAEIRWRSEECVGSRYQVGNFDEGSGGFPDVERCWFNHVILAGDPAFSPPLNPNTSYTVTIQAVGRDGTASEPVMIEFTTTS